VGVAVAPRAGPPNCTKFPKYPVAARFFEDQVKKASRLTTIKKRYAGHEVLLCISPTCRASGPTWGWLTLALEMPGPRRPRAHPRLNLTMRPAEKAN
jgi:hypothetical protein